MKFGNIARSVSVAAVLLFLTGTSINADYRSPSELINAEPFKVEATAYWNPKGNKTSTGKKTIEGVTVAGAVEWIGCTVALYRDNDGEIGDFLGYREITDCGYGQSSGYGKSKLLKGKTIGTIENGKCIDIYFDSYEDCVKFGRKTLFIQVIESEG